MNERSSRSASSNDGHHGALARLDERALAVAFEHAVFHVHGSTPPLRTLVRAYLDLSEALTQKRSSILAEKPSAAVGHDAHRLVRAIVFSARSLIVMRRIFQEFPPPSGPLVEVGAGVGPAAIAAALSGASKVILSDVDRASVAFGRDVFVALGLATPDVMVGDGRVPPDARAIAVPFALNEMVIQSGHDLVDAACERIKRWLDALPRGGILYILEPGLMDTARTLGAVRDRLQATHAVGAPCTHDKPCPLVTRPRDWCHFRMPAVLGPIAQQVVHAAGRTAGEASHSWLVFRAGANLASDVARVLEVHKDAKTKLRARLCVDGQAPWIVVLNRTAKTQDMADALKVGSRVRVNAARLVRMGDGFRAQEGAISMVETDTPLARVAAYSTE